MAKLRSGTTIGGSTAWHAGNDGSGSGLDADLLDGQQGSYYLDWTNVTNKPDPVVTVTLTGDVTGTANTTLTDLASGTVSVATTIAANSVVLGTDTTGNYVASVAAGSGISVTGTAGEGWTATVAHADTSTQSSLTALTGADVVSDIDVDGFGHVTAMATRTLTTGDLGATTVGNNVFKLTNPSAITFPRFNADNTVSALDAAAFRTAIGAGTSSTTGTVTSVGGTGTVSGLTLSGTVTTSGNLTLGGTLSASIDNITDEHRLFNNMGDDHNTRTSFDATTPSYNFGWRFVQGNGNGPGVNSAAQYYSLYAGLGNNYAATGAGSYGMQLAIPRNVTNPYIAIRYNENNSLGSWQKISAGYADSSGILAAGRTIGMTGDVTWTSASFNGSANVTGTATLANSGVTAGTYGSSTQIPSITVDSKGRITSASNNSITVGDGTLTLGVSGTGLTGSATFTANQSGNTTFTVTSNATSANTASAIVARDGSGNFSAGTITASLSGNASTATTLQTARTINGVSFNGGANITITANTSNSHVLKFDTGTTEGTDLYTFNGGAAKIIDIKAGTNVTLTKAAGNITISSTSTTYTGSKGITLSGTDFRITGNEIPGSVDLNTYRTTGFYAQNANTDAASGTNYPTANAGILQVINDDYGNGLHTTQLYSQYNSTNYYHRTYYNGTWTGWRNLAQDTTYTVNNGTLTLNVSGTGLSGSQTFTANQASNVTFTVTSNATSANTASTIVARDGSGNFSAGTITADLNGNASTATTATRLTNFTSTTTTSAGTDNSESTISYIGSISLFGQTDGALYSHVYNSSWKHNIFGDYRTGQLAVRGKNNGTWQAWRTVWDSGNLTNLNQLTNGPGYITAESDTLGTVTSRGNTTSTSLSASRLGINNTTNNNGYGISLFGGATNEQPTYGLMFQGTATFGTYGGVTADWATYFTMNTTAGRGWIFKAGTGASGNVASINVSGAAQFASTVTAPTFSGSLSGNASTATTLATGRTIGMTGDVTWTSASFNGSANVTGTATLANSGVTAGTYGSSTQIPSITVDSKGRITSASNNSITVGDGTLTLGVSGTGLTGSATFTANQSGNTTFTVTSNATSANTVSTIVARDASGNFSAGTITAALSGNASTATTLQTARTINGVSFDGSANITISSADSTKLPLSGGTLTGELIINKSTSVTVGTNGGSDQLELINNGSGGVIMSFHRSGAYAINMGLDADNVFRLGGWSNGTNTYRWTSDTSGNFTAQNNVTAYSDIRLKTDIEKIPNALTKVKQISGYTFTRTDTGSRQTGLIAQEVQKVLPEAVLEGEYLSLAYGNMVGLLVEAIKEQQSEIDELKALVKSLIDK